jgi:putative Mg2+ transporter-C (MgtC) family protein
LNAADAAFNEIALRLAVAVFFGALIGLERSYRGRPAGFRTHTLVCLASSALMLVTVYESQWFQPGGGAGRVNIDPTRMAQGIMTGIGFLGAGVIMKEGLSVRGLTTAASIWITPGIGILVGIGFYLPAGLATALALGTLSAFRWIEQRMRTEAFSEFVVRFAAERAPPEPQVREFVSQYGFSIANVSHRFRRGEATLEYRMTLRTTGPENLRRLAEALRAREDVAEFRISPMGD